jgi:hypothetical protein
MHIYFVGRPPDAETRRTLAALGLHDLHAAFFSSVLVEQTTRGSRSTITSVALCGLDCRLDTRKFADAFHSHCVRSG